MDYADLIDRVAMLSEGLEGESHTQAARVLEHCRALSRRPRQGERLIANDTELADRRELGRLVEQLGRRQSRALPAAVLGRAALADLAGDRTTFQQACRDCEAKLGLWGL
jgi:hypothetical protein